MLLVQLDKVLTGLNWNVLFVDDNSPDGTADHIREFSKRDPRVSCLCRTANRGLASACIEGMTLATAPFVALIDADLQHDEALLPQMYDALASSELDIIIGSRYMDGGGTGELGLCRRWISRVATRLSRIFVPKELTDPMSGFFMIRRDTFLKIVPHLYGKGFKILLDIFASSSEPLAFREFSYVFRQRNAGESKLSGTVIWDYLEFIIARKTARLVPSAFMLFVLVGAVGVVVHLLVLGVMHRLFSLPFEIAQMSAIWLAMTSNFFLNNVITYRHSPLKKRKDLALGLFTFYVACALGAVVNLAVALFVNSYGMHWAIAGLSGGVAGAVWNYSTTKTFTWRKP